MSALDYLIREKLIMFADEAERHPEFAKELPRFLGSHLAGVRSVRACRVCRESEAGSSEATAPAAVYELTPTLLTTFHSDGEQDWGGPSPTYREPASLASL
jgi:hypothetical protein